MSTELIAQEQESPQQAALTAINSGRAAQEVQAAVLMAKRFPRDENQSLVRIKNACKRRRLAEAAIYTYPRGSTKVEGPSIRLAECMAQNWGNLDFGIVELEQKYGESVCMAYCWDLETNTRQTKVFTVKHERVARGQKSILTDPRDIYEVVANYGARRTRACILGVIPGDIVDEALEEVEKTLKSAGGNKPLVDRIRDMAMAFDGLGVKTDMLEKRMGHRLDSTTESELIDLRKIYTSIKDGMSKREDWFQIAEESIGKKAKVRPASELLEADADELQAASEGDEV